MKKRLLSIVCVVLVIILYLQYGTRAQILSTFNNTYQSQTETNLTVTANKLFIANKEKYCDDLLKQYQTNSLPNIFLSTDLSEKPEKISFTIYTNELLYKLGHYSFVATYYLEDNSENYSLEIE
ncbi:MAG: hypothetical protein ACLUO9_05590 [Coprococcus comes]